MKSGLNWRTILFSISVIAYVTTAPAAKFSIVYETLRKVCFILFFWYVSVSPKMINVMPTHVMTQVFGLNISVFLKEFLIVWSLAKKYVLVFGNNNLVMNITKSDRHSIIIKKIPLACNFRSAIDFPLDNPATENKSFLRTE